jgi:hypothetical protein
VGHYNEGRVNCAGCGGELTGQQRKWCSDTCSRAAARAGRLAAIFNLTVDEYDVILAHQGGRCAICGRPPKADKRLAVDHDHQTGYVRGLLCFLCNRRVLGARSATVLVKTAEYVTNPPARAALGRDVIAPGRPAKVRRARKRRPARRKP